MKYTASAVLAILVIIGLVVFCNRPTPPKITKEVDKQYHSLCYKLADLPEVDETNYKDVEVQLESIKWQKIEDGGSYEDKSKELFLKEKRDIAKKIQKIYDETKEGPVPQIIAYPDDISE